MPQMPSAATRRLLPGGLFEWRALDELESAPLRAGVAWWQSVRGDRPYPARQDLRPRQMAGMLAHMSLVKVIDGGADFEHRIVGDVMVQAFTVPIQNRRFSEIAADSPLFIERSLKLFREVVNTGTPLAWRSTAGLDSTVVVFTHVEIVLLPLGRGKVDHIVGFGGHWSGSQRD